MYGFIESSFGVYACGYEYAYVRALLILLYYNIISFNFSTKGVSKKTVLKGVSEGGIFSGSELLY